MKKTNNIWILIRIYVYDLLGFWFAKTSSYSQEGEDIVLKKEFAKNKKGFYVEVGAHHPFRFSNTFLFYKMGWSGICIDPLPGTKRRFKFWRKRDLVIEKGVSQKHQKLTYYMFSDSALNTFDSNLARERKNFKGVRLLKEKIIDTLPLSEIIENYLPKNKNIDFLSIDVEGLDLEVLKSNNWKQYRPRFIIAESLNTSLVNIKNCPVENYLSLQNYEAYAKTGNSVIYKIK